MTMLHFHLPGDERYLFTFSMGEHFQEAHIVDGEFQGCQCDDIAIALPIDITDRTIGRQADLAFQAELQQTIDVLAAENERLTALVEGYDLLTQPTGVSE